MTESSFRIIMALLEHNIEVAYSDNNWDSIDCSLDAMQELKVIIREWQVMKQNTKKV